MAIVGTDEELITSVLKMNIFNKRLSNMSIESTNNLIIKQIDIEDYKKFLNNSIQRINEINGTFTDTSKKIETETEFVYSDKTKKNLEKLMDKHNKSKELIKEYDNLNILLINYNEMIKSKLKTAENIVKYKTYIDSCYNIVFSDHSYRNLNSNLRTSKNWIYPKSLLDETYLINTSVEYDFLKKLVRNEVDKKKKKFLSLIISENWKKLGTVEKLKDIDISSYFPTNIYHESGEIYLLDEPDMSDNLDRLYNLKLFSVGQSQLKELMDILKNEISTENDTSKRIRHKEEKLINWYQSKITSSYNEFFTNLCLFIIFTHYIQYIIDGKDILNLYTYKDMMDGGLNKKLTKFMIWNVIKEEFNIRSKLITNDYVFYKSLDPKISSIGAKIFKKKLKYFIDWLSSRYYSKSMEKIEVIKNSSTLILNIESKDELMIDDFNDIEKHMNIMKTLLSGWDDFNTIEDYLLKDNQEDI